MRIIASVNLNRLTFFSGKEVQFRFPIGDAMEFDEIVVVRLEPPRGVIFNENVYGITPDGAIAWQIGPEYPPDHNGAWGGLENRNGEAVVSNSESRVYYINPQTGHVTRRGFSER